MYESGLEEEYEKLSENRKLLKKPIEKTEKNERAVLPKKLQEKKKELVQKKKNNNKQAVEAIEN